MLERSVESRQRQLAVLFKESSDLAQFLAREISGQDLSGLDIHGRMESRATNIDMSVKISGPRVPQTKRTVGYLAARYDHAPSRPSIYVWMVPCCWGEAVGGRC